MLRPLLEFAAQCLISQLQELLLAIVVDTASRFQQRSDVQLTAIRQVADNEIEARRHPLLEVLVHIRVLDDISSADDVSRKCRFIARLLALINGAINSRN